MNVDASQGSHFFHNISSFRVGYLALHHDATYKVDWERLDATPATTETEFVRHVRLAFEVVVKLDGHRRRGVILVGDDGDNSE